MPTILLCFGVLLLGAEISAQLCPAGEYNQCKCGCPPCMTGVGCADVNIVSPLNNPCPCENGGLCKCHFTGTTEYFVCVCPLGYYGVRCEQFGGVTAGPLPPDEPCLAPCINGGTCVAGVCKCTTYWRGATCELYYNGQPCSSYPCKNGGTCSYQWGSNGDYVYTCACMPEFAYPPNCEQTGNTACAGNLNCQNGGRCVPEGFGYACECPCFFDGIHCEFGVKALYVVDPCQAAPCLNGATCYCSGHVAKCKCRAGYSGVNCETFEICDKNGLPTCDNGGVCSGGSCFCQGGFTGPFCEFVSTSPCAALNPCINGATCRDTATAPLYECICPCGTSGTNCEWAAQFMPLSPCAVNPTACILTTHICMCQGSALGLNTAVCIAA